MKLRIWTEPGKSRKSLIFIDDKLWGALPVRALPAPYPENYEGGDDDAAAFIALLKEQALNQLLEYLARFEHSEWQSRQFLKRRRYHESIIDECLTFCLQKNYINDARFAELLIRSQIERGGSKTAIISKLYEQHIKTQHWQPVLDELYDREDASDKLFAVLNAYCGKQSGLEHNKLKDKVFSYLYRKGYELDLISAAWERYSSGED